LLTNISVFECHENAVMIWTGC